MAHLGFNGLSGQGNYAFFLEGYARKLLVVQGLTKTVLGSPTHGTSAKS